MPKTYTDDGNHAQCLMYRGITTFAVNRQRADAQDAAVKLTRAQADPEPHRDVVMLRRRRKPEWHRGMRRQMRKLGVSMRVSS